MGKICLLIQIISDVKKGKIKLQGDKSIEMCRITSMLKHYIVN